MGVLRQEVRGDPLFFKVILLNYKSFHFRPSSQHPPTPPIPLLLPLRPLGQSGFPALWEVPVPSPSLQVQEGECPNRLDPQNPVYVEETGPSVIVNGFSERLRASHSQRIRPNSENLVRSRPRSVPVQLALVNSH